eukprot:gb/GECG01014414.1/.p1 GENE.gb/GECG01014414.1/~~gb/GECG01014414.1/.p1  ORF type:complete len:1196 (+),score=251.93 gb/GECG01014414.1/:1-3588(+)
MSDSENVKVAVRMRPMNQREKDQQAEKCVRMSGPTSYLRNPENDKERTYTFDFSYDSSDPNNPEYATQQTVWKDLGEGVLQNAWDGYNCSLFAYGQTGSGKSYSMVGYGEDRGIIPVASEEIFKRIQNNEDESTTFKVETSMLEIYMEKIRDLFNPHEGVNLKIRMDPKDGFFVEGLSLNRVTSYEQVEKLMEMGNKARTIAATNMNATSSRAHTIFQIKLVQTKVDAAAGKATDKTSRLNLVDLAGSERQKGTGATGDRLKEGAAINKSLSSLGQCIKILAHNSDPHAKKQKVPYRDSVLTQLLQNSLGGNAKTIMIAAISPADINYDETLSTLRYADSAKQIKNKAVVNEDPNEKLIRQLREEIEELRRKVGGGGGNEEDFQKKLEEERERIRKEMEQKLKEDMLQESQNAVSQMNAQVDKNDNQMLGYYDPQQKERMKTTPHISNLHEDPMLSEKIIYFIEDGKESTIGRRDAKEKKHDIPLGGLSILEDHAVFNNDGERITLKPQPKAKVYVNGEAITEETELHHRYRLVFGNNHVYKLVVPREAGEDLNAKLPNEPEDVPEEITYDFVMMEMNKSQAEAVAEQDQERRKEIEKEHEDASEKVQKIENQIKEEREKAINDALEAAGGNSLSEEEQQKVIADAEEKFEPRKKELEKEIEDTKQTAKKHEKQIKQRSLLDEKLLKTIPLVNEANATAEELGKTKSFEVKLMANQTKRSSLVKQGGDDDDEAVMHDNEIGTEVYVVVHDKDPKIPDGFWHYDKFVNRLYIMREMYQIFVEEGRTLEGNPYTGENDPFFDPAENERIGKATIYLDPLLYVLDVDEATPIIDYKGAENGELLVRMIPHLQEEPPEEEDLDMPEQIEELKGKPIYITIFIDGARGLPRDRNVGFNCKFPFYLEETSETEEYPYKTINPRLDYRKTFQIVVTDDFIRYLNEEAIDFEVFGRYDDGSASFAPEGKRNTVSGRTSELHGSSSAVSLEKQDTAALQDEPGATKDSEKQDTVQMNPSQDEHTPHGGEASTNETQGADNAQVDSNTSELPVEEDNQPKPAEKAECPDQSHEEKPDEQGNEPVTSMKPPEAEAQVVQKEQEAQPNGSAEDTKMSDNLPTNNVGTHDGMQQDATKDDTGTSEKANEDAVPADTSAKQPQPKLSVQGGTESTAIPSGSENAQTSNAANEGGEPQQKKKGSKACMLL